MVEQRVGWLKESRAVGTRFDKLAVNYLATVKLAMKATGSVDATSEFMGVTAGTAKRHYLHSKAAFEGNELLKQIMNSLLPK